MTHKVPATPFEFLRRALDRARLYAREFFLRSRDATPEHMRLLKSTGSRRFGKFFLILGVVGVVLAFGCTALWWRLSSGPMALDMATPWLTAALEEKFGSNHRVEVGGTVLERDESGRTALRLRDIVVRDVNGTIVASAPRAEVGIAGSSLFTGRPRAERLNLIGAEMAVRIERDGRLAVFAAGAGDRPLASVVAAGAASPIGADAGSGVQPSAPSARLAENGASPSLFASALGWLQSLDAAGLDGGDLTEVGLKSGILVIDDARTGKHVRFDNINLSLSRLKAGGVALNVTSVGAEGPWSLSATVMPSSDGRRTVEAVARDISPKDVMMALRLDGGHFVADLPVSMAVRAEIEANGMPRMLQGHIQGGAGYIGDPKDPNSRVLIDELQGNLRWDPDAGALSVPIEILAGPSRVAVVATIAPPREQDAPWAFSIPSGMLVLSSRDRPNEPPLVLNQVQVLALYDTAQRRVSVERATLNGVGGGVTVRGAIDFSEGDPRLMLGFAGTRMTMASFKRLWPAFIARGVRAWVEDNLNNGTVEKVEIATNLPFSTIVPDGPPLPEQGLAILIETKGTAIRPVEALPAIRDADLTIRVSGKAATVLLPNGQIDLPSGRRLGVADGVFEALDINAYPVPSRTGFRVTGPVESVGELLAMEPIRDSASTPFDIATARGAVSAQIAVTLPVESKIQRRNVGYTVDAEIAGFSVEKFWRGQRADAPVLVINANQDVMQIKGDLRIAGVLAAVEYRKPSGVAEADVRIQATLDDGARARLGFDVAGALTGPLPVKLAGRMRLSEREGRESRFTVEADLTPTRISDLVPGWYKNPGRSARASFTVVDRGQTVRLEDLRLEGSGAAIRGTVEVDAQGDLISAELPNFAISDGDKATLKAERTSDGTLRLSLRGDVFDGRGLIKSTVSGQKPDPRVRRNTDLDLDIKVGAMTGYHGEALRGLELRMTRRGGHVRSFSMTGRLGREAHISGRLEPRGNTRVMFVQTNDAGALFRFSDIYAKIYGGTVQVAMDPPVLDDTPRQGLINLWNFSVRGERALEQVASTSADPNAPVGRYNTAGGVAFTQMRAEFTRSPGRFTITDGLVRGPAIGATVEGNLDYARNEVRMRGTFVPAYALNNLIARVPVVGLFFGGGENEGLLGVTYQVVGSPGAPILQVNPVSAMAPGILRKLFEFRGGDPTGTVTPPDYIR